MFRAYGVAVVFGVCAIGDDKNLHIFKKPGACPETLSLIAVDLIERFGNRHPAPFKFNMHQRQTVDQHRYIIAVGLLAVIDGVLINDLQVVIVDMLFIQQIDIFIVPSSR